jgi:hypothetical protein
MKKPHQKNNQLAFIATILLLIAIPISVLGTQNINDIRNQAEEKDLFFSTEFDENFSTAFSTIGYEKQVAVDGKLAEYAEIQLGCNQNLCTNTCKGLSHNPPPGLSYQKRAGTLVWENPQLKENQSKWPVVISAYTEANEDQEALCIAEQINLEVKDEDPDISPQCELFNSPTKLDSVPKDREANFIIRAMDPDDGIEKIEFFIKQGKEEIYSQTWDTDNEKIVIINKDSEPALSYEFNDLGQYSAKAKITDASGESSTCTSQPSASINVVIPGDNGSPEFQTDPYKLSQPSTSIKEGTQYSYTVKANDPNDDEIEYFIINETGWLNFNLVKNEGGDFEGTFSGTPTATGSYTVAVALNDGFHNHYSSQIWVVNVDSEKNDTPKVEIVKPEKGASFLTGDNIYIEWDAEDDNLIENFALYISPNPTERSTWQLINGNIGYNYDSYIWDSLATPSGNYYFVLEASDNQDPPATGQAISEVFSLGSPTQPTPPDTPQPPEIPESYPRIINIKPTDKSEITDQKPLISADLKASNENTIDQDSVSIKLDDEDITDEAEIRGGGENEGSIIYTPAQSLSFGSHKISVSFRDTEEKIAQKSWTFTIEEEGEESDEDEPEEDVITIFGFKLPRRIALVVGIGVILLLLALIIPWLFYAAWKRSNQEDDKVFLDNSGPGSPPSGSVPGSQTPPTPPQPSPPQPASITPSRQQYSQQPSQKPVSHRPNQPIKTSTATNNSVQMSRRPQSPKPNLKPAGLSPASPSPKPPMQSTQTQSQSPPPKPNSPINTNNTATKTTNTTSRTSSTNSSSTAASSTNSTPSAAITSATKPKTNPPTKPSSSSNTNKSQNSKTSGTNSQTSQASPNNSPKSQSNSNPKTQSNSNTSSNSNKNDKSKSNNQKGKKSEKEGKNDKNKPANENNKKSAKKQTKKDKNDKDKSGNNQKGNGKKDDNKSDNNQKETDETKSRKKDENQKGKPSLPNLPPKNPQKRPKRMPPKQKIDFQNKSDTNKSSSSSNNSTKKSKTKKNSQTDSSNKDKERKNPKVKPQYKLNKNQSQNPTTENIAQSNQPKNKSNSTDDKSTESDVDQEVLKAFQAISPGNPSNSDSNSNNSAQNKNNSQPKPLKPDIDPQDFLKNNNSIVPPTKPPNAA